MDRFLKISDKDKLASFVKAETDIGLSEDIIEKDFWVCWILKELFLLEEIKDHLTFKGGTSLSKIYKVISRFSEDIDVSVERVYLGFKDETEPSNVSGKKAKSLIADLGEACKEFVQKELYHKLHKVLEEKIEISAWKLEIDYDDNDGQTILFTYPKVTSRASSYIKPMVRIELGARSDHWPVSMLKIAPYVAEVLPSSLSSMDAEIRVLNLERTFWEKATILHSYANYPDGKGIPERQSRHFYDFYSLLNSEGKQIALKNIELLEKVCQHKKLYFKSAWADYDSAKKGSLKLIPGETVLKAMEKDYRAMAEMFSESAPSWKEMIDLIEKFERDFNK